MVKAVYALTAGFPSEERYTLTSQMRRSALSVPCNIAEGSARSSRRELVQFLMVARGSLMELETQMIIAEELGYLGRPGLENLKQRLEKIFALLSGFINAVRRGSSK